MNHRKMLEILDPIVAADNHGRVHRLSDALLEFGGNWDMAREVAEIKRLDDAAMSIPFATAITHRVHTPSRREN